MIDLSIYVNTVIVVICGCIGLGIKHVSWLESMANEYIPVALLIIGTALAVGDAVVNKQTITLNVIASGMVSGLISTGAHQLIQQSADKLAQGKIADKEKTQ